MALPQTGRVYGVPISYLLNDPKPRTRFIKNTPKSWLNRRGWQIPHDTTYQRKYVDMDMCSWILSIYCRGIGKNHSGWKLVRKNTFNQVGLVKNGKKIVSIKY